MAVRFLTDEDGRELVKSIEATDKTAEEAKDTADAALPKAGGKMTGNLEIEGAAPALELTDTDSKSGTALRKDATADTDNGTTLEDTDDDGKTATLVIRAAAAAKADKLVIRFEDENGTVEVYQVYGQHNKPTAADVGALPTTGGGVAGAFYVQRTMTDGTVVRSNLYPSLFTLASQYVSSIIHTRNGEEKAALVFNETGVVLRDLVTGKDYALYGDHKKPDAADLNVVSKDGDTMTGQLLIEMAGEYSNMALKNGSKKAFFELYEGSDIVQLTNFSDTDNKTKLVLYGEGHALESLLRLVRTVDGETTGYNVYHEGHKPTAAEVGAVDKTGDTMTGDLVINRESADSANIIMKNNGRNFYAKQTSAGVSQIINYKDTNNQTRLNLQTEAAALDQLLQILISKDGTSNMYSVYHEGHKPTPDEIDALPAAGGTVRNGITFEKANVNNGSGRLLKNHSADADYGMYLSDEDKDGNSVKLIVSAKNNSLYFSPKDGETRRVFHEGNTDLLNSTIGHNLKSYKDLSQLGLTRGTETLEGIVAAMPDNSRLQIQVGSDNNLDVYPNSYYGTLVVERSTDMRNAITFTRAQGNAKWFGSVYDGAFSGWERHYTTSYKPTPDDIGAAAASHTHNYAAASHTHGAGNITAGTFAATGVKAANGTDYTTARVRNIVFTTSDPGAKASSSYGNGSITCVYE